MATTKTLRTPRALDQDRIQILPRVVRDDSSYLYNFERTRIHGMVSFRFVSSILWPRLDS